MDVRLITGLYAGEIREIPAPEAQLMIADGRAEDPRLDSLQAEEPGPEQPKPRRNKQRS